MCVRVCVPLLTPPLPPPLRADQHRDLPEWLEYHQRLGVSRVYVMDTGSTPPLDGVLRPYVQVCGRGCLRRGVGGRF